MLAYRRILPVSVVLAGVMYVAGCGGGDPATGPGPGPQGGEVASIVVSVTSDTLTAIGNTAQFTATARDAAGNTVSGVTFTWTSSDDAVATVDGSGLATARGNGEVTITASASGKSSMSALVVAQQVATVTVSPTSATLGAAGATQQFSATAVDANGNPVTGLTPLWVSSDHSVATVAANGLATATGGGLATITAAFRGVPGSATLSVAQTPTEVAFTVQPSDAVTDRAISPALQLEIRDANGRVIPTARNAVTLTIGTNPGGARLSGSLTVNAVNGVATFAGISLSEGGAGYTLDAASGTLTGASSTAFDVSVPTVFVGYSGGLAAVDRRTNQVMWSATAGSISRAIVVSPDQAFAYVANAGDATVSVIDLATKTEVTSVTVGATPWGVVITPDGSAVYVSNSGGTTVSVIETATNTVTATITVGVQPLDLGITPDGSTVYVSHFSTSPVSVIATTSNTVTGTVDMGGFTTADVVVTPDGASGYVTRWGNNDVAVFSTTTNTITTAVPVTGPWGIAVSPDGSRVYAANFDSGVTFIETAGNTAIGSVPTGSSVRDIEFSMDGAFAYASNNSTGTVSVIQRATGTVFTTIPLTAPWGIALGYAVP